MITASFGFFLACAPSSWAQYGPFAELPGNWAGEGVMTLQNGGSDRIRCQALYVVSADGNDLEQSLRCAGAADQFDLKSAVTYRGGDVFGTWSESGRKISGRLEGRAGGGHFKVDIKGPAFDATLTLVTYGNIQSISIRSNNEVRDISIRLVRSN